MRETLRTINISKFWGTRDLIKVAFEHLIELEIVTTADQSSHVLKQYQPMRLLVTAKEIDEAVVHYTGCPSDVKQWSYMDCVQP